MARFPDFVVGMLLFRLYKWLQRHPVAPRRAIVSEVASVLRFLAFYLCAAQVPKVYRYSCYYWLPVSMVITSFSLQRGVLSRVLSHRPFVVGGEISYGFYLIHLFVLLAYAGHGAQWGLRAPRYAALPVLLCVALLLSWLSYRFFERPMNRKIKQIFNP